MEKILKKNMSRQEFIMTLGFGIATVVGLSALLQLLGKQNPWRTSGYGSSSYGGVETIKKG